MCSDCRDEYVCTGCGYRIHPDDVIWVNDRPYCDECVYYCPHCNTYGLDELIQVTNSNGQIEHVCAECALWCDSCNTYYLEGTCHECVGVPVCV